MSSGDCKSSSDLKKSLIKCGNKLKEWNNHKRRDLNSKIVACKRRLSELSNITDDFGWNSMKSEENLLNTLLEKNEMY